MIRPFLMISTSSITMQSLGKMDQCTPAVGGKIWRLYVFVCHVSSLGALCVRGVHNLNKHCVAVYWSISMRFQPFFARDCYFGCTTQVPISAARWRHNFCEIAVKNFKNSKNQQKSVHTTSYRQVRDLKKIPPQWFRDKNADVLLYKNFLCTSLYSVDSQCQTSYYRQSKNGSERTRFCAPKVVEEVNFSKYLWAIVHLRDCSCTSILRFFSAVSDGATAES